MSLSYLLDENVPYPLGVELGRREPALQVRTVGGSAAPTLGTKDPQILIWCEANDFALVTNNRRSMPRHLADHLAQGRHVPGIFVISLSMTVTELAEELILIAGASLPGEHQDVIRFLPLT